MKKKLIVDRDGIIKLDGKEISKQDLTSEFLDELFKDSMLEKVDFNIADTTPISKLFLKIRDVTDKDSQFSQETNLMRNKLQKNINLEKEVEDNTNTIDDLIEWDLSDLI